MTKFSLMLVLLATSIFMVSCDDDDDDDTPTQQGQNIVSLAQGNSDLSILVQALTEANLVTTLQGDGPFTVFAPNNAAFTALLESNSDWNSLSDIPAATLEATLLYHVLSGEVKEADLTDGYVPTLSKSSSEDGVSLKVQATDGVMFNSAMPVLTDIQATNGVIHVINEVMLPPNMVSIATGNSDFSILVQALQVTGLTTDFLAALASPSEFTVFAPTNSAFEKLLATEEDWNGLGDIPVDLLNSVLSYHVVAGNVRSTDLQAGEVPTLLDGANITINLDSGVSIGTIAGQNVPVQLADVQATNGVVHVIDEVLIPLGN
ncbi:fasciclin domain-containing protein [Candidatus Kapabacteria bacterium]|nr:fasciclin domain-containing protein [Candidatus Kapabacteria bacterium]